MKCPYCNNEMARGYLCCGGGHVSLVKEHSTRFAKKGDYVNLKNNKDCVKGYQCEGCKIIMFDCNSREGYSEPY